MSEKAKYMTARTVTLTIINHKASTVFRKEIALFRLMLFDRVKGIYMQY